MNKLHKSNATVFCDAAAEESPTTAWHMQLTQLNAGISVLVHILSFVRAEDHAVQLVCKKWAMWGHYATFDCDWRKQEEFRLARPLTEYKRGRHLLKTTEHVFECEPQMVLESVYIKAMLSLFCWWGGSPRMVSKLLQRASSQRDIQGLSRCLMDAVRNGDAAVVSVLLGDGRFDPSIYNGEDMCIARIYLSNYDEYFSCNVHSKIMAEAMKDAHNRNATHPSDVLFVATANNAVDVMRVLMNDPRTVVTSELLITAVDLDNCDALKLLLSDGRIDPTVNHYESFRVAVRIGRHETARLLLRDGCSDPTYDNYRKMRAAVRNQNE